LGNRVSLLHDEELVEVDLAVAWSGLGLALALGLG